MQDKVPPNAWMNKRNRQQEPAATLPVASVDQLSTIVDPDQIAPETTAPTEHGGPSGKEPTRYGDWEKNGRCIDF
jgi:hypothetical protein